MSSIQESSGDLTMANKTISYPEASRLMNKAWRNADTQRPVWPKLEYGKRNLFFSIAEEKSDRPGK